MKDCTHEFEIVGKFEYEKELQPMNVLAQRTKVKMRQVVFKCKQCQEVKDDNYIIQE